MKIRKQVYSLDQYLKLMKAETIRTDQECQRRAGQWNANMVNELIFSVLTDNYIPPIILGEEITNGISKLWIIDGLQRSTSLSLFRYGNTKITKNIDEYMVTYQRKVLDKDGVPVRDEEGELLWESVECDIRNKTYTQLPEELQERFDGYQIETVIHQDCDTMEISKLVRKLNNHKAMNSAQKGFTYADVFAKDIRQITKNRFFLDVYACSRNDRKNGTIERVVADSVLLCNYPDDYKKDTRKNFEWLNSNATLHDFNSLDELLTRLTASIEATKEIRALFVSKNSSIFTAVFKRFTESGRKDAEFGKFLEWFVNSGNTTRIGNTTWETLNTNHSTRDVKTVHGKIDYLLALAEQYFKEY